MNRHLIIATTLANLLDNSFGIGGFRFGLSALFDLIPGVGDMIDAVLSLFIVLIAIEMNVPLSIIGRMVWNIFINFLFGLIPIIGDTVYLLRKVNMKNLKLLKQYSHASPHVIEGQIIS